MRLGQDSISAILGMSKEIDTPAPGQLSKQMGARPCMCLRNHLRRCRYRQRARSIPKINVCLPRKRLISVAPVDRRSYWQLIGRSVRHSSNTNTDLLCRAHTSNTKEATRKNGIYIIESKDSVSQCLRRYKMLFECQKKGGKQRSGTWRAMWQMWELAIKRFLWLFNASL